MKKLNLERLGEQIVEYKLGEPFISTFSAAKAARQVAEKINEIIDFIAPEKETKSS